MESQNSPSRSMPSSPPPAGTDQEDLEGVSGEASLPLHAAETGAGGERGPPSASEGQADGADDEEEGDAMEEDEDGGGGDDTNMELGEEEEEEDSDYSSGYWLEYDDEQLAADLEEIVNLPKNAEEDGEGSRQDTKPEVATCCVCMEPWTSGGAHRICCIPCGHVYGRSCLEKWLRRCGGTTAKCPQCGDSFDHEWIINLYGIEYLWNHCIHDQPEFEAAYDSAYAEYREALTAWELKRHAYNEYQGLLCDLVIRFMNTGERGSTLGERPPMPGLLPMFPSREQFSRTYYLGTLGTGCSRNQAFGRTSCTPSLSREITPFHTGGHSPGAFFSASVGASHGASPGASLGSFVGDSTTARHR